MTSKQVLDKLQYLPITGHYKLQLRHVTCRNFANNIVLFLQLALYRVHTKIGG